MEDKKQPASSQNAEGAELSEADRQYVALAEELIKKYRLGVDNRVGLMSFGKQLGDIYFFSASISYVQTILHKHYVVFTSAASTAHTFIQWHNANGANIEEICLEEEQVHVLRRGSSQAKSRYKGILDSFGFRYNNHIMNNQTEREDVYANLTRPVFPKFDAQKYIDQLGVIPGKTVFVIPSASYHGTLPLYFWTLSIELFKLLGYHVIVNAPENETIYGEHTTCFFPPLDDIVGLCNLCGIVYSIRTGLSEFLASESCAKIYIFGIPSTKTRSPLRPVSAIFPFIDNSDHHIVEIPLPANKEEFFWIKSAQDITDKIALPLRENIRLRDSINFFGTENLCLKKAKPYFYGVRYDGVLFIDRPPLRVSPFCIVQYQFRQCENLIALSLNLDPPLPYVIHIALKNAQTKEFVKRYEYYNCTNVLFALENDGTYCASVHIVHPTNRKNCWFETEPLQLIRPAKERIKCCTDYKQYVQCLEELKDDAVILITSRDAHTNWSKNRKLDLEKFQIASDLTHMFRYSWLCVIDGGKVVRELASPDQEIRAEYEWDGNQAELTSAGYNVNHNDKTPVSIKINGEEKAVNHRGLNFVVWDKEKNCLLDSVCFDTYLDMKAYRRK